MPQSHNLMLRALGHNSTACDDVTNVSFCVLARLVQHGVRFVQLYHTD